MKRTKLLSLVLCGILICFIIGSSVSAAGNLLHDDFSSGTGSWTADEGTCAVENGEYSLQNLSGAAASYSGQAVWTDYSFEADVKTV